MKYKGIINRTAMLLILLLTGWAAGCPVQVQGAETVLEVVPDPENNLEGSWNADGTAIQPLTAWNLSEYRVCFMFDVGTGNNAPAYYSNGSNIRLYAGNTFSINLNPVQGGITEDGASEESGAVISRVEFQNSYSSGSGTYLSASTGTVSYDSANNVYTWENTDGAQTADFTVNEKQVRITRAIVYIVGSEDVVVKPKVPVLSQTSCQFFQSFDLTITDMNTPAATVRYTLDGTDPSADNGQTYTAPITIPAGANVTVKAVAINENGTSSIVSATYTFVPKHKLSFKLPNKNGVSYISFSSSSDYGSLNGEGSGYVVEGEQVELSIETNSGYELGTVTMNGSELTTDQSGWNGYYVFTMPQSDVEVVIDSRFNPSSPSDPQPGSIAKKYKLTLVSNPVEACSLNGSGEYEEGTTVSVSSYARSGYVFAGWTKDGESIGSDSYISYTMPAQDVVLTANYVYNPSNPGDPEQPKLMHPLTVVASPAGAGTFSTSGSAVAFGEDYYVYAYPRTGYRFKGWIVNGVAQKTTDRELRCTMTDAGAQVVGMFLFDPSSPANPGANSYNPETGQVILDDFPQGNMYSTLSSLVDGNIENVRSLVVKGKLSSSDYGSLRSLKNVASLDLSRTGGFTTISSYTFEGMSVSDLELGADITEIGSYVFSSCGNLTSISMYAAMPPVCNSNTFNEFDNKANCMVYVPADAVALYKAADYWKDFSILPITSNAHVLQVNLPADASDGRYKRNSIEIVNVNSGVRQKYVVSDRTLYTFNGLQKDEQYNVYMFSQTGLEIGCIENVVIPDQDIEVTFDNLKPLHTVFAKVLDPAGTDVTSQVTVEWLKPLADETVVYLRKTATLGEVPEGQQLICRVALDNKLGVRYSAPEDVQYTVSADNNTCTVSLTPLRSIELTGTVVDGDGAALSGAAIAASQTLNGKYTKTYTTKTDRNGQWKLSVLDAPETNLTYSATECVNVNNTIGAFQADVNTLDLGKTVMKSIVGARISYGFTYREAGAEELASNYSDYQNVAISVFNVTQNRAHNEVSHQYPLLAVLDENINTGDELKLTATSKSGAFNPIERTVTVDDNQRAEVTFDIIGKGGISASFEMTDNPAVTAMLYGSNGELVKKQAYSEAKTTFTGLEDGEYTLVTMGQSDLMNSILRLSSFGEIGLTEGKDYVKNVVSVETGKLTEVKNSQVPAFDESLFYYTNDNTSFSANKSSITTGNYLTLRAAVDFKGIYKNDVSNVALIVDLPEACNFVEQSVIQGPNLLPYTLDNGRLTVPLGKNYESQTRFCMIPTRGGTLYATASIVFDYNGKTMTQPIGVAASEIKFIEILVPEVIAEKSFIAKGTGPAQSTVEVYSTNGNLLGVSKIDRANRWKIDCKVPNVKNYENVSVYAIIKMVNGMDLETKTKTIKYQEGYPVLETIQMNTNPEIVFDFKTGETSASWYILSKEDVTFTINFSNNSPEVIKDVFLNIYGEDGSIKTIECRYDQQKNVWYAVNNFDSFNGVVNLSVNYTGYSDFKYESDTATLKNDELKELADDLNSLEEEVVDLIDKILEESAKDNPDEEKITEWVGSVQRINSYYCPTPNDPVHPDSPPNPIDLTDDLIKELADPGYTGGKVVVCGSDPKHNDKYTDEFANGIESAYNKLLESEDGYIGKMNSSVGAENPFYIASGDFDFESNADTLPPSGGQLSWTNSAGDTVIGDNPITGTLNMDSEETVMTYFDHINNFAQKYGEEFEKWCRSAEGTLTVLDQTSNLVQSTQGRYSVNNSKQLLAIAKNRNPVVLAEARDLSKQIDFNLKAANGAKAASKAFGGVGSILGGFGIGNDINNGYGYYREWSWIIDQMRETCNGEDVSDLIEQAENYRSWITSRAAWKGLGDITLTGVGIAATASATITAGASFAVTAGCVSGTVGLNSWESNFTATNRDHICEITRKARQSKSCPKDPFMGGFPGTPAYRGAFPDSPYYGGFDPSDPRAHYNPNDPRFNSLTINHDPAGFVYEAVLENRVEGVQASIYYKETVEDMYGDPQENVVLWDAEEYAQKNPLFTDANGMYQWDVPQGLWQVKFEKDGYQTAYSEWLPVPPPQLEVNIGIVQNKQPEVTEARAYEEGVEVQFDKYMDSATLTTGNIYVTANNEKLNGTISLVDAALADEYASEEDADALRYASRVRFVPETPLSVTTGEVKVFVSRNVLSYAGIPMTQNFSQTLDVEKEVQDITADDVKVLYGGQKQVTVYALPYDAAVGRKLHIANTSDMIATIDVTEAVLDAEGKAVVTVRGELPGSAQLQFSIDDVTATGSCDINVVTELVEAEAPAASRASGTAVYRGSKIQLTTDSKDGVIYFTTDGSCPCDADGTRRKYTVPIVINDNTTIKAMTAVGTGSSQEVSETVEFNYTLKETTMDLNMADGWTWMSHNMETALPVATVAGDAGVSRILTQDKEAVRDPQYGMFGTLTEIPADQSFKVQTSAASSVRNLTDYAWNPATPINMSAGWNWLGYPVDQTMSVDEAFAPTEVDKDDVIVGQNGFATYDGEKWVGTLEVLIPGLGYMYQSVSAKDVVYNTSIVSNAAATTVAGIADKLPLAMDIHKYASVMPVIATIKAVDGRMLDNEDYQVLAFNGTECRGIGRVVDGLVMMNIYGNVGDAVTFQVVDNESEESYANTAGLEVHETVVGTLGSPYEITLSDYSGIGRVDYDGNVKVYADGDMLRIKGIAPEDIRMVEMYDMTGTKVLHETKVTESGVRLPEMLPGAYVVIVDGNGRYTYHKISVK